jgi:toxin ParE1/3/4
MPDIRLRPAARREIDEIVAYYIETASDGIALRFRKATLKTFRMLAARPFLGVVAKVRSLHLKRVRMWRVREFEDYLVFYLPLEDGIQVERVIHAARDYRRVLKRRR